MEVNQIMTLKSLKNQIDNFDYDRNIILTHNKIKALQDSGVLSYFNRCLYRPLLSP